LFLIIAKTVIRGVVKNIAAFIHGYTPNIDKCQCS
jgi:hypothetical protein